MHRDGHSHQGTAFLKSQLRFLQTRFPGLRPLKFRFKNLLTKEFGLSMDRDFKALAALRPVGLVLDIGGNWGQSIYAIKRCCSPQKIISFEPNGDLARRLEATFSRDPAVEVRNLALSDKPGSLSLFVPRYGKFIYDGLASIDREEAYNWLNEKTIIPFDPGKLHLDECTVDVLTLDELDLAPEVVKIDVQGAEDAVVRGGMRTFERFRPASIIEAPSAQLTGVLGDIGLKPYFYDGSNLIVHDGRWKNTLFLTDEQADLVRA